MTQYVGRVSFKHLKEEDDLEAVVSKMAFDCIAEMGDAQAPFFVYEEGDCGEPHAHFYFRTVKSRSSVERLLKKHFRLPPKVCAFVTARRLHIAFAVTSVRTSRQ